MIKVLDKFYNSPEYIYEKGIFATLKRINNPQVEFIDESSEYIGPCIIILCLDAVTTVPERILENIVEDYKMCDGNKVIIDTSLEDFINTNFYHVTDYFLDEDRIKPEDIVVLTSQNSTYHFRHDFKIPFKIVSINTFEYAYYHTEVHAKDLPVPEIKPRKLDYHFSYFIKNARTTRKLIHAYMFMQGYLDKCFCSYHNLVSPFDDSDWYMFDEFDIQRPKDILELGKQIIIDDHYNTGEWSMPPIAVENSGVHITLETHAYMTHISKRQLSHDHRVFMTEKTYKPFFYGLPCINPGIPQWTHNIEKIGYKTFEKYFNTEIDNSDYQTSFASYFKFIDEIANYSLSQLEDIVNSKEVLDDCKHNQDWFLSQNETHRLVRAFGRILDK